jgi:MATE family multidrug resistance protein
LPLAAVGITNAVAIILFAAIYGLLSAMSVRVGAAHGAGQKRRIPALLRNGLALGAIVGTLGVVVMLAVWPLLPWLGQPGEVLAIMFPYWLSIAVLMLPFSLLLVFKATFEAMDRPWLGTGFAFLAVGVNVPLNYALIWGLGPLPMLGLTGAGIASLIAETLALAAAWIFWLRARSMRRLRVRAVLSKAEMVSVAREGAPLGLMYVAETGAMAVATATRWRCRWGGCSTWCRWALPGRWPSGWRRSAARATTRRCGPSPGLRWPWRPRGWQRRRRSWACTGARSPDGSRRSRRSSRWRRRCSSFLPAAR